MTAETTRKAVLTLLALPAAPDLLTRWTMSLDESSIPPFERLYKTLMAHASTAPGEALRASEHVLRSVGSRLAPGEFAFLRHLQANTLLLVGRAGESLPVYRFAFDAFRRARNPLEAGRVSIGWAFALANTGRPREAKNVVERGLRIMPTTERVARARLLGNLGTAWHLAGHLEEAAKDYRRARSAFRRAGEPVMEAVCLHNLGLVRILTGEFARARSHLLAAHAHFHRAGATLHELYVETGLAELGVHEGRWEESIDSIRTLQSRFDSLGDERASAWLHRELARLWTSIGAHGAAEPQATAARRTFTRLGIQPEVANVAFLEGRLAAAGAGTIEAIARFREAREIWEKSGNRRQAHRAELEEARALLQLSQPEAALALLRSAKSALERIDPHGDGALARALHAECLLAMNRSAPALRLARAAHQAARRHPAHLERPRIALVVARAYAARRDSRSVVTWARRAAREQELLLLRFGRRSLRVLVGDSRDGVYRAAVDLVLEHGGKNAVRVAVDLLAKARSPVLIEDVLHSKRDRVPQHLVAAITRLRDELLAAPESGNEDVRHRALSNHLERLEGRLAEHRRRVPALVRDALRSRGMSSWLPLLKDRELVLFDEGEATWRAFVVRGEGGVERVDLPEVRAALRDSWIPLRVLFETAASVPRERRAEFLDRTRTEALAAFARLRLALWAPLPLTARRVVVVPFADLHGVPIEALASFDSATGDVAATIDHVVTRLPHPALLRDDPVRRDRHALLLRGPTPGAHAEVREIAELLRRGAGRVRVADRVGALDRVERPLGVLLVAAHGSFHREDWLRSGFELRDGHLGFESLRPRQIRGALVHFSSCESGQARRLPGSDLEGWTSTALAAGARELVLSLWKVDDVGAGAFSRAFYERWTEGASAGESAGGARRQLFSENAHPFHWAPFVAVGSTRDSSRASEIALDRVHSKSN